MDVSMSNEVRGIVPLSMEEIGCVAGGKSVVELFNQQLRAWCNGGPFPSMPPQPYQECYSVLQWAVANAGVSFRAAASGLIAVMRADGEEILIEE